MFTIRIKILTAFLFTTNLLMVLLKRKRARDLYSEAYIVTALYKDVYIDEWKKATIKSATEFLAKALKIGGMGQKTCPFIDTITYHKINKKKLICIQEKVNGKQVLNTMTIHKIKFEQESQTQALPMIP